MDPKYRKMLKRMSEKEPRRPARRRNGSWLLYILRCKDGTFYTGITKDVLRRFKMHNSGKGSRYTRTRRPVELLYEEPCAGRTQALVRECQVKAMTRKAKEKLVANPGRVSIKKG